MVTRIPSDDEVTGFLDTDITEDDFVYKPNRDDDLAEKALAFLYFFDLYGLYNKYDGKSPQYVLTHLDEDIVELKKKLAKTSLKDLEDFAKKVRKSELEKFKLSENISQCKIDVTPTNEVLVATFNSALDELKNDAKTKVLVWQDRKQPDKEFHLKPNFKRAVSRYNGAFRYASNTISQKQNREVVSFVYDSDLYYWACFGKRPCGWCIDQSKNPPRPLEEIPYDHIGGYCGVIPATKKYTKEYIELMGGSIG